MHFLTQIHFKVGKVSLSIYKGYTRDFTRTERLYNCKSRVLSQQQINQIIKYERRSIRKNRKSRKVKENVRLKVCFVLGAFTRVSDNNFGILHDSNMYQLLLLLGNTDRPFLGSETAMHGNGIAGSSCEFF